MRLPLSIAALLLMAGPASAEPAAAIAWSPIDWTLHPSSDHDGRVQFEISSATTGHRWSISRTMSPSVLEGLSESDLAGDGGPVRFAIARDAGTLRCEGVVRHRRGTGECRFEPDPGFVAAMQGRGVTGTPVPDQIFWLAVNDIGVAFADELHAQHYKMPSFGALADAGNHGVTLDYLRGMGGHGYRVGTLDALVRMRDHGVTPDFVTALADYGLRDLPADQVVMLRDHGVSASFVGGMRELGYGDLPMERLVQLRDHAVDDDYVRALAGYGIRRLPPDELVRLRDHGITPEYLGALRANGFSRFDTATVIALRDHGVTGEYLADLRAAGYGGLAAEDIIRLRTYGVTGEFIREANRGGRRSAEELVRLRIGG
jgi:hypothetical protein